MLSLGEIMLLKLRAFICKCWREHEQRYSPALEMRVLEKDTWYAEEMLSCVSTLSRCLPGWSSSNEKHVLLLLFWELLGNSMSEDNICLPSAHQWFAGVTSDPTPESQRSIVSGVFLAFQIRYLSKITHELEMIPNVNTTSAHDLPILAALCQCSAVWKELFFTFSVSDGQIFVTLLHYLHIMYRS